MLTNVVRQYLKSIPMGTQPVRIKAGSPIGWKVPGSNASGSLVANYDVTITPDSRGRYTWGKIDITHEGKPCGCGHKAAG
jgi:hypothetical protein